MLTASRKIQFILSLTLVTILIYCVQVRFTVFTPNSDPSTPNNDYNKSDPPTFRDDITIKTNRTNNREIVQHCFFLDEDNKNRLCSGNSSDSVSVVQSGCDTRFGNQLSVYATLLGFQSKYGLRPFITKFQRDRLRMFFQDVDFPIINTDLLQFWMRPHTIYDGITNGGIDSFSYHTFMTDPQPYLTGYVLDVGKFPNAIFLYKDYLPELKQRLKIREMYLRQANSFIGDISKSFTEDKVIYIGVHVRRTDYFSFLKRMYGKWATLVDKNYFTKAMSIFRTKFSPFGQVVFVVVTDDISWAEENLGGGENVFVAGPTKGPSKARAVRDFALLTLCNHTIMSYGTFGAWGALWAGGDTIYALGNSNLTKEIRDIQQAGLHNWTPISV